MFINVCTDNSHNRDEFDGNCFTCAAGEFDTAMRSEDISNQMFKFVDSGAVCVDCVMMIANGDNSGIEDFQAWEKRVEDRNPTEDGRYEYILDSGDDAVFFGTLPCDFCGDRLHGDRHAVGVFQVKP